MDISRDRATGSEGGPSIRLRYSRQFQSGGHAHSIDAEATLPVGVSQERREQVIAELESDVEQLARQVVQRSARPTGEARPQAPARSASSGMPGTPTTSRGQEEPAAIQRQAANAPVSASRTPISESMPATPTSSSEGTTVRLPQFINAIKKRWDMSLKEAMDLLHVTTLEGANLREAYAQLQSIMEAKNAPRPNTQPRITQASPAGEAPRPNTQSRITQAPPIIEAPRQGNRNAPPQSSTRSSSNQTTAQGMREQGPIALKTDTRPTPPSTSAPEAIPADERRHGLETSTNFAGSPKAPIPIQLGTVRDLSPRSYKFEEEEDDDDEYELPEDEDTIAVRAQFKLDELKGIRGSNAVSAERLTVLNNVVDSQVSEEQLQQVMQAAWGTTVKKKLKGTQVEKLISWAKEDDFALEVEAMLTLLAEEEG